MDKIQIVYTPEMDEEEKQIFTEELGKENIEFGEYKTKGLVGGAFDIQIIIELLTAPETKTVINAFGLIKIISIIVKKIFSRNTKKIMDNNSRPRYTNLVIRKETCSVVISNVNNENKLYISKITADFEEIKKQIKEGKVEYSEEKLKEYLK